MLEGAPHQKAKNVISDSESALDIGPSTVAGVGDTDAFLTQFCDEVIQPWKEIKCAQ
jgi:hypothetical protein